MPNRVMEFRVRHLAKMHTMHFEFWAVALGQCGSGGFAEISFLAFLSHTCKSSNLRVDLCARTYTTSLNGLIGFIYYGAKGFFAIKENFCSLL